MLAEPPLQSPTGEPWPVVGLTTRVTLDRVMTSVPWPHICWDSTGRRSPAVCLNSNPPVCSWHRGSQVPREVVDKKTVCIYPNRAEYKGGGGWLVIFCLTILPYPVPKIQTTLCLQISQWNILFKYSNVVFKNLWTSPKSTNTNFRISQSHTNTPTTNTPYGTSNSSYLQAGVHLRSWLVMTTPP